jgi:hypothetical protein
MRRRLNAHLPGVPVPDGRLAKAWLPAVTCLSVLVGLGGCSLLTIKSPERPLSTRDLNARLLTRELSAQFIAAVEFCAGNIVLTENDPAVLQNTLRWEIGAVGGSRRAATQVAPQMALLDSWALALQMMAFTDAGAPGGALFGTNQDCMHQAADDYATGSAELAQKLYPAREFSEHHRFVETYAREHPLADANLERVSIVQAWSREQGAELKLIDSVGTIPEALTDIADRAQIYGDTVPSQVMWQTQLALHESGYAGTDLHAALKQLDARLGAMTEVADASPQRVREAVADLRRTLLEVIARLDTAATTTLTKVGAERVALLADLSAQRAATMAELDVQRREVTADAARIANEVVRASGDQVRRLAREVLILLIVLAVLILSLPFAAGYLVGRARHPR